MRYFYIWLGTIQVLFCKSKTGESRKGVCGDKNTISKLLMIDQYNTFIGAVGKCDQYLKLFIGQKVQKVLEFWIGKRERALFIQKWRKRGCKSETDTKEILTESYLCISSVTPW